jgi:4-diphosphocytidyl-2-C-methyl-D-erythritol kinase
MPRETRLRGRTGRARAPRVVRIDAPAKLNLGLAVGPLRDDGFHELATIFQSISLHDTLTARAQPRGFTLTIRHEPATARGGPPNEPRSRAGRVEAVPRGSENLVVRAARLVTNKLRLQGGAHFTLIKRIPAGAGLGGGSADAAAAILATLRLHGVRLSLADRLALAGDLGSDVPFAMLGGTALGFSRGERLIPMRPIRSFRALIAVPSWRVSTVSAYRQVDRRKYGLTAWVTKLRFAQRLEREGVTAEEALRLGNTFEEVLGNRRRDFLSLCERLKHAGTSEPRLTGSGSAVFGILSKGSPSATAVRRFSGSEALYLVRSARAGARSAHKA